MFRKRDKIFESSLYFIKNSVLVLFEILVLQRYRVQSINTPERSGSAQVVSIRPIPICTHLLIIITMAIRIMTRRLGWIKICDHDDNGDDDTAEEEDYDDDDDDDDGFPTSLTACVRDSLLSCLPHSFLCPQAPHFSFYILFAVFYSYCFLSLSSYVPHKCILSFEATLIAL